MVQKTKPVYNVDSGMIEKLRFLRMEHIDAYNFTIGNVGVEDQLRGICRLDTWVRNQKWWWSLFFWAIGTMITNAYITYLKVNETNGVDKKI